MAEIGSGALGGAAADRGRVPETTDSNVAELMRNLNLTAEEEEVINFSDGEEDDEVVDWALVGKILSPSTMHPSTIQQVVQAPWGNPHGLKIRMIGEKGDNLFVADFESKQDRDRVRGGSPWIFCKHALILQDYDERLRPSEIVFYRLEIWARILNIPLGWMNETRGSRAMSLIGEVRKMDVDKHGKASGPFLRARVAIDINKPVRRGVMLRTKKAGDPEWFDVQYEKLPFYCLNCGVMGHSELQCADPVLRNEAGKLPYDVGLRAQDDRRKRLQNLVEAAAASYRSASPSSTGHSKEGISGMQADAKGAEQNMREDDEVTSPLKAGEYTSKARTEGANMTANRQLFQSQGEDRRVVPRKRKSKSSSSSSSMTPDLNLPAAGETTLVPSGTVLARVNQLAQKGEKRMLASEELSKKQRKGNHNNNDAPSAAAASDSPRRAQ
jgi:hypothetical protein